MSPLDFKKEEKRFYLPPAHPVLADVPEMNFFMVDGEGDPNEPEGAYQHAVELLYALSYAVRMGGKKRTFPVPGYREYVVPPLEGLWWGCEPEAPVSKKDFRWISMIRQPGFVTQETLAYAQEQVAMKKPHLDTEAGRLDSFREGLCVQCLHTGPYDDEPPRWPACALSWNRRRFFRTWKAYEPIMRFTCPIPGKRLRNA